MAKIHERPDTVPASPDGLLVTAPEVSRWIGCHGGQAALRLADLLVARGDLDELRARADAGDQVAASRLLDELRARADAQVAASRLFDELRAQADAGDRAARIRLAELAAATSYRDLAALGWIERVRIGASEGRLAGGQAEPRGLDQILQMMRSAVDAGSGSAADREGELAAVAAGLRTLDPDGARMAAAIRTALDMLLDGQHTGRYRCDQLHKTEKTHAGTLVGITLARTLRLPDGTALDYTIAGADVDCKFSHRMGGWMIPPEADGQLMLLVQASDEDGTWSAGLIRAVPEHLSPAGRRHGKRALNDLGRAAVYWLHHRAALAENALIRLPERDVAAIFALGSGQQRVNELFRRAQRMRVSRTVVATVAMQDDYMKRVRDGGGARDQLRGEGIVIFGDYDADQLLASALDLPRPGPGEFVSARLARRGPGHDSYARSIRLEGTDWLLASPADPAGPAPALPR